MSTPTDPVVLAEGLLEVDYPTSLAPDDFDFSDIVAINPSTAYEQHDFEFPADLASVEGELVAVVARPPRRFEGGEKPFAGPGHIDHRARQGAPIPEDGTEVVLGSGPVRLRQRTAGGRPTTGERTAIGVGEGLDAEAVRSLLGIWVRLELRP